MRLGYNTNGFPHHTLPDAIGLLARLGYRSIAITLDHHSLNPFSPEIPRETAAISELLQRYGLGSVVETGARFLLDAEHKHEPTLVSPDPAGRERRVAFLCRAVDLAADLGSDCVSLWSGVVRDQGPEEVVWDRLIGGIRQVLAHAHRRGVTLGFEPEPGMFIDTMGRFQRLAETLSDPCLQLTLDVGHVHCLGDGQIPEVIRNWGSHLVNVHIEDMRRGVHEHLQFGDGELDFPPIIAALREVGYAGGLHVELSRHGHEAPAAARRAYQFLSEILG